jgi:hypothetical protein
MNSDAISNATHMAMAPTAPLVDGVYWAVEAVMVSTLWIALGARGRTAMVAANLTGMNGRDCMGL